MDFTKMQKRSKNFGKTRDRKRPQGMGREVPVMCTNHFGIKVYKKERRDGVGKISIRIQDPNQTKEIQKILLAITVQIVMRELQKEA